MDTSNEWLLSGVQSPGGSLHLVSSSSGYDPREPSTENTKSLNAASHICKQESITAANCLNGVQHHNVRPKRLTSFRNEILVRFLDENTANPLKYGEVAGEVWIEELISRLRKRNGSTGNVSAYDVMTWLETPEIAPLVEEIRDAASRVTSDASPSHIITPSSTENSVPNLKTEPSFSVLLPNPIYSAGTFKNQLTTFDNSCREETEMDTNHSIQEQESSTIFTESITNDQYFPDPILSNEHHNQLFEETIAPSSEVQVLVSTGGFVIHLPACSTPTTIFLQPTAWNAFKSHPTLDDDDIFQQFQVPTQSVNMELEKKVNCSDTASKQHRLSDEQTSMNTSCVDDPINNGEIREIGKLVDSHINNMIIMDAPINNEEIACLE